ncbi:pseudouridine synthase [Martensiomyces pterosporus]|nr:pseudouridine synthase [Martensiomyces pterosporus]
MRIRIPDDLVIDTSNSNSSGSDDSGIGPPLHTPSEQSSAKRTEFIQRQLPVIFENDAMAVFRKPAGLPCQGGTNIQYSVDSLLAELDKIRKTGAEAAHRLVHRLDRGTTGALVVAKTRLAAKTLTRAFHDRTVRKTYIAVLHGIPHPRQGTVSVPLVNAGTHVKPLLETAASISDLSDKTSPVAKPAITKYKVLKTGTFENKSVSVVEVDILTGRKHQIRVHCAKVLGCAVLGDRKYAAESSDSSGQKDMSALYLHLFKLQVPNVGTNGNTGSTSLNGSSVFVRAPFPDFWTPVFKALGITFSKRV